MDLSQSIRLGRSERRLSQKALIEEGVPCTQSMLSMMESGERRIPKDIRRTIADKLDHGAVYSGVMLESTGGVGPAYLDGPNVDRHHTSVHLKLVEELSEALDSARVFPAYKPPVAMTERDFEHLHDHLDQVLDVFVCSYNYVDAMAKAYGLSLKRLFDEHQRKLKGKRLVLS